MHVYVLCRCPVSWRSLTSSASGGLARIWTSCGTWLRSASLLDVALMCYPCETSVDKQGGASTCALQTTSRTRHDSGRCIYSQKPKPEPCDCCEGSGRRRCEYCHGTGPRLSTARGHPHPCCIAFSVAEFTRMDTLRQSKSRHAMSKSCCYMPWTPSACGLRCPQISAPGLLSDLSCAQGAMMVGDERFCSLEQGCKPCPVCNSTVRAAQL